MCIGCEPRNPYPKGMLAHDWRELEQATSGLGRAVRGEATAAIDWLISHPLASATLAAGWTVGLVGAVLLS